tara:strand:+ start:2364 stop:2663 length:300 start_codon:yes stop_codon:yes gene_type:complete
MPAHKDKFKTGVSSKAYSKGHKRIFGERLERRAETGAEIEKREANRKYAHAKEAEDGKKDAQWYIDHEQRVSQDPNFQPRNRPFTKEYSAGHERIFGEK